MILDEAGAHELYVPLTATKCGQCANLKIKKDFYQCLGRGTHMPINARCSICFAIFCTEFFPKIPFRWTELDEVNRDGCSSCKKKANAFQIIKLVLNKKYEILGYKLRCYICDYVFFKGDVVYDGEKERVVFI